MIKKRLVLAFGLLVSAFAASAETACVQALSEDERTELSFLEETMADPRANESQLREVISKRFNTLSAPARTALFALVSRWNFNTLIAEFRRQPAVMPAFEAFNAEVDEYQRHRAGFAGGQFEADADDTRLSNAHQNLQEALAASTLPAARKEYLQQALRSAVEGLRKQGEQSLAQGSQFLGGLQAGGLVVGGAVASAGLIWLSVVTGGAAAPVAGAATTSTGAAFLALVSGATGSMGTVGMVGAASITGNAAITARANEEDFFCALARQTQQQGPLALERALQAAALGGLGAGGLRMLPAAVGAVAGGALAAGGAAAVLTHAGVRGVEVYRLEQKAAELEQSGHPAQAQVLQTQAQRLALEAGLDSAAVAAGLVPVAGSLKNQILIARVSQASVGRGFRLRLETLPESLRASALTLDRETALSEDLEQGLAHLIVRRLHDKGVAAELFQFEERTLVRVLPSVPASGTPHWLNSQASQMTKQAPGHVLAFDPSLPLDSGLQATAYYDPRARVLALPLRDLDAPKMSDAGVHEWTHYLHAKANAQGQLYRGQAQVNIRPTGQRTPVQARALKSRLPGDYRAFHSLDEVFAFLKNAQVNLKAYEKQVALVEARLAEPAAEAQTLKDGIRQVNELYAVVQDNRMHVETIGEYDAWALRRVLRDLGRDRAKLVDIGQGEYPAMGHAHVMVLAGDHALGIAKAMVGGAHPEVMTETHAERVIQLLEGQVAAVARARADARAVGERADALHAQLNKRLASTPPGSSR